jgi:hypothetical protein
MKKYGLNELRQMFLDFFESKDHLVRGSYSLVPHNDNSLLLINAGMAPLKPYFTGQEIPQEWLPVRNVSEPVILKTLERQPDMALSLRCLEISLLEIILRQKQFTGHGSF